MRSRCIDDLVAMHALLSSVISQQTLITTQMPSFLGVMACHSLERTQADPLYLSENLIS